MKSKFSINRRREADGLRKSESYLLKRGEFPQGKNLSSPRPASQENIACLSLRGESVQSDYETPPVCAGGVFCFGSAKKNLTNNKKYVSITLRREADCSVALLVFNIRQCEKEV